MPSTPRLVESLLRCPVVRINGYDYFVHPLSDGIPHVDPRLLEEVVDAMARLLPKEIDLIITPEAMGIPLASGLALKIQKPFTVARKRRYGLPAEIEVRQATGYSRSTLHLHGLRNGMRVAIVDDVVSTGGTLRALSAACQQAGATILGSFLVFNKGVDLINLERELGHPVKALVRLTVKDGTVQLEA